MKQIGIIVFIGLIIANMITYKSCNNFKDKYKLEHEKRKELYSICDSLLNLPPDTFYTDPIFIKGKDSIVYITKFEPKPNEAILEPKIYRDTLSNDSIDLSVAIDAVALYSIKYKYKPIYKYQEKIIERKIPEPYEVIKEIKVPSSGLFFNAGLGYSDRFSGKVGLMYLTKKQSTYNYDLIRYGDINIHCLSYGIKF